MAKVIITATAQLDAMLRPIQAWMVGLFERLRKWPEVSGARPLSGNLAGHY